MRQILETDTYRCITGFKSLGSEPVIFLGCRGITTLSAMMGWRYWFEEGHADPNCA